MTMLPPEDRPPLAARVDAAMEEASVSQVEQALIYASGIGVIVWVVLGLRMAPAVGLLLGLLAATAYFLVATRGRVPRRLRPYFLAAGLPVVIAIIWIS